VRKNDNNNANSIKMISINTKEKQIADDLIIKLINNQHLLDFPINLDKNNNYPGFVHDFNISFNEKNIGLDLKQENDLFLLFVLASAWSRTGQWENAAYLVAHLKHSKNMVDYWLNTENLKIEKENRFNLAKSLNDEFKVSRVNLSFREDTYDSIHLLAENWDKIKDELAKEDFFKFMEYLRNIKGLGAGSNRMFIKIPLILRELRCQEVYDNIPGKFCCVPDQRVKEAAKELEIKLPNLNYNLNSLIKVSSKIYSLFGDLYDLPLFSWYDLRKRIYDLKKYH